jgi:hypothetical protein
MLNRLLKFLVGSAAGVIVIAGLVVAGGFAVGVWRSMTYQAAKQKCDEATAYGVYSYARKEDRAKYKSHVQASEMESVKLYGRDGYAACMNDEGH